MKASPGRRSQIRLLSNLSLRERMWPEQTGYSSRECLLLACSLVPQLLTLHSMRRISFKRKQKRQSRYSLSSLFSYTTGGSERGFEPLNGDETPPAFNSNSNVTKDGSNLDWYAEGPGRRVGYDDFTAIDWIYEYTKERQRKRFLYSSGQGLLGYGRQLLEAGNVWLVLVATGVAVGIIAAAIDITTDWLGDLKTGYCRHGRGGGKFYLNRSFCCWGHDDGEILVHSRLTLR